MPSSQHRRNDVGLASLSWFVEHCPHSFSPQSKVVMACSHNPQLIFWLISWDVVKMDPLTFLLILLTCLILELTDHGRAA